MPPLPSKPIEYDSQRQMAGYALMFVYTLLSLGKFNRVEVRLYLAAAGILSIFFGVAIGLGLTMALGLTYTPLTGVIPFLWDPIQKSLG